MLINKENLAWASQRLLVFSDWRGFPETADGLEMRAKSFLRLVHNKPLRELVRYDPDYEAACKAGGIELPPIDWEAKGMDPDQTDAEWILDLIAETMDTFPLPVQMREIYTSKLQPAWEPKA